MSERYVVIAEYKDDEPLMLETYLRVASYEEASNRMKLFEQNPKVIRVAMARLDYENGNRSLFK